jgi:hypothetical protein
MTSDLVKWSKNLNCDLFYFHNQNQYIYDVEYFKNNIQNIKSKLIEKTKFKLSDDYEIVIKNFTTKDSMKWHRDDCKLIKDNSDKYKNKIQITSEYFLTYEKLPLYTALFYFSDKNDYKGGVIEFANNFKLKPSCNDIIVFDSNLVHRVSEITSGERKVVVVKFY